MTTFNGKNEFESGDNPPASPIDVHDTQQLQPETQPSPVMDDNVDHHATVAPLTTDWKASKLRYEKIHKHASGGLGAVFLAHDLEVSRNVALKEILPDHAHDFDAREAFRFEAHITGRLEHPGVVPIYGIGETADGQLFYAMRFIHGITMEEGIDDLHSQRIKASDIEYRLKLRKLLNHFIDTCNVLDYAHSRRVIHRDLKPRNIMLGKFGETLVVDWGLAKSLDQQSKSVQRDNRPGEELPNFESEGSKSTFGMAKGTVPYMSPEQAQGILDQIDHATDVYGLGATLYHLLTGAYPGKSLVSKDLFATVCQGRLPSAETVGPWIPKPLSAICAKAMAFKKSDRFASAAELARDIERWLADEPVSVYRDTLMERSIRWLRHHRAWAITGAVSIMTIALVSSIAFWRVNLSRQAEQQSRSEATKLYGMARKATDDLLVAVSERLRDVPSAELARQELLQQAAKTYSGIIELRTEDDGLREQAGLAAFKLGEVQFDLKEFEASVKSYQQARVILDALVKKKTDREKSAQWQTMIGKTLIEQSRSENELGLTDKAMSSAAEALKVFAALSNEFPNRPELIVDQSYARIQFGNVKSDGKNLSEAVELFRLAERGAQNALEMSTNDAMRISSLHMLCRARINYAHTLHETMIEKPDESKLVRAHEDTLAAAKQLCQLDKDGKYVDDIANAVRNYGDFLLNDLADPKQAIKLFQQSIEIYEQAISRFPDTLKYRVGLVISHVGLGDSYVDDGNRDAALKSYGIAVSKGESLIERNATIGAHLIETAEAYRKMVNLLMEEPQPKTDEILSARLRAVDLMRKLNEPKPARLRNVVRELIQDRSKLHSVTGLAEMASDFLKLPKPNADEFRTEEEFQGHLYREAVALAMVVKSLPSSADGIHAKIANAAIDRLRSFIDNELKKVSGDQGKEEKIAELKREFSEVSELSSLEPFAPDAWSHLFRIR